ncbi:DUF2220 family protein [Cytobacillus kochii]|uniref:Wadjet anti-phage system protein JetD domain-containing protein n=1 Tax=Cytobacillus kochii TaxID=859143 RepID=UPI001CD2DB42|nr:Wadjet anti-phage system protein JetD domain-containing protein [Cytobacillus kochii]MCA1024455.1 DUF2220 family protein [Cytobacillus kochii]
MYSKLLKVIVDITKKKKKKTKHSVKDLELSVKNFYYNQKEYEEAGGYRCFYEALLQIEKEGLVQQVKSSRLNNLYPVLHEQYWLFGSKQKLRWNDSIIFMLLDELDIKKYRSLPFLQTEDNLSKLLALYRFMKTKDGHNWINREERSLMLFGDEKFLGSNKGKLFLNRINLAPHDLKIEEKQDEFEYWISADIDKMSNVRVLITEGKATYRTFKKQLAKDEWIFKGRPDLLIFGQGNGIVSTFPYIERLLRGKHSTISYAGDIDPSGLSIYYTLVHRFPEYHILLAEDIYHFMMMKQQYYPQQTNQVLARGADQYFKTHFTHLYNQIESLFTEGLRIPQEVINFDTIKVGG